MSTRLGAAARRAIDLRGGFRAGKACAFCALCLFAIPLGPHGIGRAAAQEASRTVENPPMMEIKRVVKNPPELKALPKNAPMQPPSAQREGAEKTIDLNVVYTESKIYNPATGRDDKVRLRSYAGKDASPTAAYYVAPTIEANPGDSVAVTLRNNLPPDPSCTEWDKGENIPHCFNGTNLHTHGLWVSPKEPSDDVLLMINPGDKYNYKFDIPRDHPAGTFWYHPHKHGSTALQVSSGMAGALIIRGDRMPTPKENGDIDTLLMKTSDGKPFNERISVLQQIQYACVDAQGNVKVNRDPNNPDKETNILSWRCDTGDVGGIEFYEDETPKKEGGPFGFGPGSWNQSGRYTSINGLVLPTFKATAGEIERWRLIHAGVRDTIALQFFKVKPTARLSAIRPRSAAGTATFIDQNCGSDPLPYHVIASDGLTMAAAQKVTKDVLQPGYRSDALVVFPEKGRYCVVNAAAPASGNVSRKAVSRRLLGFVEVAAGVNVPDIGKYVVDNLVAAAEKFMPEDVRAGIVADLNNGLRLTKFTPHPEVKDAEVKGYQYLTFNISHIFDPPARFQTSKKQFSIGGDPIPPDDELWKSYDMKTIDRHLMLDSADEWTLQSYMVSHPFHIHVNPFQIVKIIAPDGKTDVSAPGAVDNFEKDKDGNPVVDPQYSGLKGVWKDTLWVKSLVVPDPKKPVTKDQLYTIVIRTRYERYDGEFVQHCHILDHEDQGMMENISIDNPSGGQGGTAGMH